jgi:site-specific recombinase XerD
MAKIIAGDQAEAASLPWAALRYQHTAAIRAALLDGYKPNTANRMLAALRGVLKQAWLLGLVSADDYQRAIQLAPITGETLPAGRELSPGEIGALMIDCINDPTPGGARDAAIIGLMYAAGLRREEVINIDLADYDQQTGRLVVRGKRSKERAAYLVNGAADALADWLTLRGQEPGPLFMAINKGGRLLAGRRMTPQAVYHILAARAERAGVADFSPHDLRRTFVSDLLEAGADIATVAKMAGHSNIQTTARYDRRPEQAKQAAAKLLHIPYRRRMI